MDEFLKQVCIRFCESASDPGFQPQIPAPKVTQPSGENPPGP